MSTLQAILAVWLVITACLAVIMAVDIILGWLKRPRAIKGDYGKPFDPKAWVMPATASTSQPKESVTIHYPMTDEQEAREETIKKNDAKGIDTPIDDLI